MWITCVILTCLKCRYYPVSMRTEQYSRNVEHLVSLSLRLDIAEVECNLQIADNHSMHVALGATRIESRYFLKIVGS